MFAFLSATPTFSASPPHRQLRIPLAGPIPPLCPFAPSPRRSLLVACSESASSEERVTVEVLPGNVSPRGPVSASVLRLAERLASLLLGTGHEPRSDVAWSERKDLRVRSFGLQTTACIGACFCVPQTPGTLAAMLVITAVAGVARRGTGRDTDVYGWFQSVAVGTRVWLLVFALRGVFVLMSNNVL